MGFFFIAVQPKLLVRQAFHLLCLVGDLLRVQRDGSFHFHGAILYAAGYGGDYALQITTMVSLSLLSDLPRHPVPVPRTRTPCP